MSKSLRPWLVNYLNEIALSDKCTLTGVPLHNSNKKVQVAEARCVAWKYCEGNDADYDCSSLHIKKRTKMTVFGEGYLMGNGPYQCGSPRML
jgi:hypothetical protein